MRLDPIEFSPSQRQQVEKKLAEFLSVTGELTLPDDIEMVMPGDHTRLEVNPDKPIALEPGSRFAIREGGKTVGSGVVTEVIA